MPADDTNRFSSVSAIGWTELSVPEAFRRCGLIAVSMMQGKHSGIECVEEISARLPSQSAREDKWNADASMVPPP
jgi:hypothetical protein